MRRFSLKSFLQRVTTDQWQQLLIVIGLVGFSALVDRPYRRYWLLVALGFFTIFVLRWAFDAFFSMHCRYAQPRRGQIAAVNSTVGLVLIWGSVLWLDNYGPDLLRRWQFNWQWPDQHSKASDGFHWSLTSRPPTEIGGASDGWLIGHLDPRGRGSESQRVILLDLMIRGFLCLPFLMWTLQLLNRVFRETLAVPRPWRVQALGVMGAVLCFLVVWRGVPWDVIWGPNRDLAVKWLCVTLIVGLFVALPISEQV